MGRMEGSGWFEFTKRLNLLSSCDVLVAGGGIAGTLAALAAARAGANTMLVEAYGFLGGTPVINAGQHYCFCGDTVGQGELFDELLTHLMDQGATVPYEPWDPQAILDFSHENWDYSVARYFDSVMYQLVLQEMALRQANLRLLLHTRVVDAVVEEGHVTAVILHNPSGLQAIRPQAVVDCTGDANLAAAAGFPCTRDDTPVPLSLRISLRDTGEPVTPVQSLSGAEYESEADMPMVALTIARERVADFRSKVVGVDAVDGQALTQAELASRRKAPAIIRYLQTHGYPTYKLDSISTHLGVRIGRRIAGHYTLNVEDVRKGARFDDAIGRGTANLSDMNLMDGSTEKPVRGELAVEVVPVYQIPYRSLLPRGSRNMLVAGRCMSADAWALSSARMMPTCAMMGQAAGIAAAWSAAEKLSVTEVDVAALQRDLRAKGAEF